MSVYCEGNQSIVCRLDKNSGGCPIEPIIADRAYVSLETFFAFLTNLGY